MKSNMFLIASLLILVGMGAITVSCKKEKVPPCKAKMATINSTPKDGGDDEDPIIRGKVKKHSFEPVDSAFVETITYGTNIRVGADYTDELGDFVQLVEKGIYYFKVTIPSESTPYVTDTIHVNEDVEVTILVN